MVWLKTLAVVSLAAVANGSLAAALCEPLSPLAPLSAADEASERAFCAIAFDSDNIALCPKTWSTSPAALVYDLAGSGWDGRAQAFEAEVCARGGSAREAASRELAFFKNSLNGRKTSGTFAPASLLYYHLSRYLNTRVQVPVAVPVSFPAADYRQRIVAHGLRYSDSKRTRMLHEGWLEMDAALAAPADYHHSRELFIADASRLWGVLLMEEGRRYGPELNGTRASGWGEGQNRDFQRSAPFIALRSDQPLAAAINTGIAEARKDAAMAKALAADVAPSQVAWWMHELTEIVLLDFILGQQDRIGNIDYLTRAVWLEEGALQQTAGAAPAGAITLKVSVLNDNDAGVRSGYANFAARTDMLAGWHHMDPALYQRLQALAQDFAAEGPLAQAVRGNYRLSASEAERVLKQAQAAAASLQQRCEAGALRFDLSVANVLAPDAATAEAVPCR